MAQSKDATVRDYTQEWDAVRLREAQQRIFMRAMDALLARHDAGEVLSEAEYQALTWEGEDPQTGRPIAARAQIVPIDDTTGISPSASSVVTITKPV